MKKGVVFLAGVFLSSASLYAPRASYFQEMMERGEFKDTPAGRAARATFEKNRDEQSKISELIRTFSEGLDSVLKEHPDVDYFSCEGEEAKRKPLEQKVTAAIEEFDTSAQALLTGEPFSPNNSARLETLRGVANGFKPGAKPRTGGEDSGAHGGDAEDKDATWTLGFDLKDAELEEELAYVDAEDRGSEAEGIAKKGESE